ncbi:TonB family protein [Ereboglobus sp. PH5-5]|uniref:TonB family protein n=1 Tax=unclassified Ereboglobus TaxID=2626932 RepID=UPI00240713AC|nr:MULTISPECIES: TonB family protein [unclassified Ereboglobus]MDF9827953.1 TonB family protein [Ereboglobus sp. PH5-10]MDF9834264.1 TonB family protein [Ereboglobus sp. PH5-5]
MKIPSHSILPLLLVALLALGACKDSKTSAPKQTSAASSEPRQAQSATTPQTSANDADFADIPADLAERYKTALQSNNAAALLEIGKEARDKAAAIENSSRASTALAVFSARAVAASARLGNTEAMLLAARNALDGYGVPVDRAAALELYTAAGDAGEAAGYNAAARMLVEGKDAPLDVSGALALIEKAIALGSTEAKFLKGSIILAQGGDSVPEAMRLLMEAARADNAEAQYLLAKLHREGKYAPRDEQAAAEWTKYAADLGLASASTDYARLTLRGKSGADGDVRAAIDRLIYAADQGNSNAALQLAFFFQSAKNPTPEDFAAAQRYAQMAHDNGESDAALVLATIALRNKDYTVALEWLEKDANNLNWRTKYAYELATKSRQPLATAIRTATYAKREEAMRHATEKPATPGGDKRPAVIKAFEPPIPPSLTSLDAQISVNVRFIVDENGVPTDVKLLNPSPYEELNQSVLDTVGQWRFSPGVKNGVPVKTRMQLPLVVNTKR